MTTTKVLAVLVGAAAGLGSAAFAQQSDLTKAHQAELIADAEARTSGVGPTSGFIITNGSNKVRVGGYNQFRVILNSRSDQVGADEDWTHGAQLPRTRIFFDGTVVDPNLGFFVQGDFSKSGGGFTLLDAVAYYQFDNGVKVAWGQKKLPFSIEQLMGDDKLDVFERSAVDSVFNAGRSQGIFFGYDGDEFSFWAALSDGWRAANTDFNSAGEADYAVTARGQFRWAGKKEQGQSFTSFRNAEYYGFGGVAVHWQDSGDTGGTAHPGGTLLLYTADVRFGGNGWNVFLAGIGASAESNAAGASDVTHFGVVLQGGIFVSDAVELFARYDGLFLDDEVTAPALDPADFHFITVGGNYFVSPESHAFKFTGALVWAVTETAALGGVNLFPGTPNSGGFGSDTLVPVLGDPDDGEFSIVLGGQVAW